MGESVGVIEASGNDVAVGVCVGSDSVGEGVAEGVSNVGVGVAVGVPGVSEGVGEVVGNGERMTTSRSSAAIKSAALFRPSSFTSSKVHGGEPPNRCATKSRTTSPGSCTGTQTSAAATLRALLHIDTRHSALHQYQQPRQRDPRFDIESLSLCAGGAVFSIDQMCGGRKAALSTLHRAYCDPNCLPGADESGPPPVFAPASAWLPPPRAPKPRASFRGSA